MGIYIYSVRTTKANLSDGTVAYALNYLSRSTPPGDDERNWNASECAYNRRLMAAAESTWDRRNRKTGETLKGCLVYLAGDDDKPRDGDSVLKYNFDEPCCYDCDKMGEHVGFLRSRKVGRKTVWDIVPDCWSVTTSADKRKGWSGKYTYYFSAAEALAAATAIEPGAKSRISVSRAGGKPALERVAEPTAEETRKVKGVLLSGPWPVSMWADSPLRSVAETLVQDGTIELYREESGTLNYLLSGWQNMGEAASEHLGAPRGAVDYDVTEDNKVVCIVATVGRFEGYSCSDVCSRIKQAGQKGRKFAIELGVTLTSSDPKLYTTVEGDRISFLGGKYGGHSLALSVSSDERLVKHWEGYCETNGATPVAL